MTRINAGVSPKELTNSHLMAEHYEMKRIANRVASGRYNQDNIPTKFKLGVGHVKFFYNKLGYLLKRYKRVRMECLERGFNVQDYSSSWDGVPKEMMNDYKPTKDARKLVLNRIKEKILANQDFFIKKDLTNKRVYDIINAE